MRPQNGEKNELFIKLCFRKIYMLSKLVSNEDAMKVEANQKHRTGEGWEMHSSEEAGMVKKHLMEWIVTENMLRQLVQVDSGKQVE